MPITSSTSRYRGFSLVEMAIVLVVLGVLARASLLPLSALEASRRERQVEVELAQARDALIARLVSHGALPCPAPSRLPSSSPSSRRLSSASPNSGLAFASGSDTCPSRGRLPAARLALSISMDREGNALDPWGRPYVYSLSTTDHRNRGVQGIADWANTEEIGSVGIAELRGSLSLCREARDPCSSSSVTAEDLVFVVMSRGADPSAEGLQALNAQTVGDVFTLAPHSLVDGHRFDDALVWTSRSEAVWWLLRAHRLP